MSDFEMYDARVRAIRAYNQPILDGFRAWLEQSGLSKKTVENHVENYAFRRGAQDCRITNEVASSTRSDFSGSPAICWSKRSTAIEPISLNGWRIVVSGGFIHSVNGMSSKPMMLMSRGTCIPCSERAR